MQLAMKREALEKLNRLANEMPVGEAPSITESKGFTPRVLEQLWNSLGQRAREWILETVEML
jgi:hypothetical protein